MNAAEINQALSFHPVTKNVFVGCFAADQVPGHFDRAPAACIVNTDPAHKKGEHWIALYKDEKTEFFDSYGKSPDFHGFSSPIFQGAITQTSKLQSDLSTVCGQYAMLFVYSLCSSMSFDSFVSRFTSDRQKNDRFVLREVNKLFKIKTELFDPDIFI